MKCAVEMSTLIGIGSEIQKLSGVGLNKHTANSAETA
jgi:hypothetical protein